MLPQQYEKITTRGVVGMIALRLETGGMAWINDIAMKMSSDQASEDYGWLGMPPAMREFIGGRTPAELREFSFAISNKDYEGSILIKSKDMRRDKTGQIQLRVNQLADRALDHPASLLSTLIMSGEATACYDGQYFFDTDHAEGDSGQQSNDIGVTVTTAASPTSDEMGTAIMAAIQQLYTLKDDRGQPMNQGAKQFTVMVPPPFMASALKAVTALLGASGQSATLPALKEYFDIKVAVNPRLTWTTKFAVFRTDDAAKPFILQQEGEPDIVALGEGSEFEQLKKEHLFGIDWTGNVGFGYWQHACLVTLSGS